MKKGIGKPMGQIRYAGTSSWKPGTAPVVECGQCGWYLELEQYAHHDEPVSAECMDAVFAEMREALMLHRCQKGHGDQLEQGGHA